jgi:hypothetical protein
VGGILLFKMHDSKYSRIGMARKGEETAGMECAQSHLHMWLFPMRMEEVVPRRRCILREGMGNRWMVREKF